MAASCRFFHLTNLESIFSSLFFKQWHIVLFSLPGDFLRLEIKVGISNVTHFNHKHLLLCC